MSLIWMDGFEHLSMLSRKYTLNSGTPATYYLTGTGRANSGNCLQLKATSVTGNEPWVTLPFSAAEEDDVIGVGVWFRASLSGFPTDYIQSLLQFRSDNAATSHLTLWFSSSAGGTITVSRSVSTLATSSYSFIENVGYYLEVKAKLGDSPNGYVVVKVNGQEIINVTGIDTKNNGTKTVFDAIRFNARGTSTACYVEIDDLVVWNEQGSSYNDFLGDVRVETLHPNGNGNSSQWVGSDANSTDNYLLVDETTYDAADYVLSASAGEKDLYTFQDMVHTTGSVEGVILQAVMSKTDSGARAARLMTRTGAADFTGSSKTLTTSDLMFKQIWEKNPDTAGSWSISDINSAEFGVESL